MTSSIECSFKTFAFPPDPIPGVYSAYLDVSFDNTLATIGPSTTPVFAHPFFQYGDLAYYSKTSSGSTDTVKAGSFSMSLASPGNAPQLLYTIQVHASNPGLETFTPAYDTTPGHETLLYNPLNVLGPSDIVFIGASLLILPVPEPSSLMLGLIAAMAFGGWRVRCRRKA